MRIALLSKLVDENTFESLLQSNTAPNPSNQNFYQRLANSLARIGKIFVFSTGNPDVKTNTRIPLNNGFEYIYLPLKHGMLGKLRNSKSIAKEVLKEHQAQHFDVLFYDALNVTLASAARIITRKGRVKTIAVCTDDPRNITGAPWYYPGLVYSRSKHASGYFALTNELNTLYNKGGKPSLVQMGIVDPFISRPSPNARPYIYYGGALFEKDGTLDLLESFLHLHPDYDLIISGHGQMKKQMSEIHVKNLQFLGQISKEQHLAYIQHADIVVNPRRYNEVLDKVSVPSKVLEYLSNAKCIVSSLSTPIRETFPDDINWLNPMAHGKEAYLTFMESHIKDGRFVGLKDNQAKEKIQSLLGEGATAKAISDFLKRVL